MTLTLAHSVEDALTKFSLVGGAGDGKTTACAMSLLNWIWRNGDEWSDSPECAHPLIRSAVINANDSPYTTAEMRAELVKAGEHGILDTWWVPIEVIAWALSSERDAPVPSVYERVLMAIRRVAEWKAGDRPRPNLTGANLTYANLTGANLTYANLTYATLTGANLTGANLTGANLTYANLTGANLTYATLTGAYLTDANLTGANLTGANLTGANLTYATLTGAYLTDAYLTDAYGTPLTGMPAGWTLNDNGFWTKA